MYWYWYIVEWKMFISLILTGVLLPSKVKGGIIQRQYAILHVFRRKLYGAVNITFIHVLTNFLDSCVIYFGLVESLSPFWIVSASVNSYNKSPDCHWITLCLSASEWSFAFELQLGFCNIRNGITIIALFVICFIADSCIHSFNNRVLSSI